MKANCKAEKRQKRKEKKRKELEAKLAEEQVKFDILKLLEEEQLNTKPNMAKFFKDYVEMIRGFNNGKILFYPNFKYELTKIIVKFLDGHELIYDMMTDGKFTPKYCLCYYFDVEELKDKDVQLIEEFFKNILNFKFVY